MLVTLTLPSTETYSPPMPDTERWLTRGDAAELLQVKPRTIDGYARDGRLPRFYLRARRAPRFRIEDVRALLDVIPENEQRSDR